MVAGDARGIVDNSPLGTAAATRSSVARPCRWRAAATITNTPGRCTTLMGRMDTIRRVWEWLRIDIDGQDGQDKTMDAARTLQQGELFPYDAPDSWWADATREIPVPKAKDFAHRAARGIIANLRSRRSVENGFERIDEDMRIEIVNDAAEIIREALQQDLPQLEVFKDPGPSLLVLSCLSCPSMFVSRTEKNGHGYTGCTG
jgi:hypothetical protein